jgi:hypothetical protein
MSEKGFRSPLEENKALIISTQKLYCSRWLWLWSQNVGLNSIVFLKTILWCSWCTLSNISCLRERRVRKNNINMILDVVESDRGLYSGWVFVDLLSTWLFDSKMKLIILATYLYRVQLPFTHCFQFQWKTLPQTLPQILTLMRRLFPVGKRQQKGLDSSPWLGT